MAAQAVRQQWTEAWRVLMYHDLQQVVLIVDRLSKPPDRCPGMKMFHHETLMMAKAQLPSAPSLSRRTTTWPLRFNSKKKRKTNNAKQNNDGAVNKNSPNATSPAHHQTDHGLQSHPDAPTTPPLDALPDPPLAVVHPSADEATRMTTAPRPLPPTNRALLTGPTDPPAQRQVVDSNKETPSTPTMHSAPSNNSTKAELPRSPTADDRASKAASAVGCEGEADR
ncbi:hypothetical protein KC319_g22304 [Hortaea werneckii]|nr:hypothetical protein KC319_g22304 [Hortaea werneckii]